MQTLRTTCEAIQKLVYENIHVFVFAINAIVYMVYTHISTMNIHFIFGLYGYDLQCKDAFIDKELAERKMYREEREKHTAFTLISLSTKLSIKPSIRDTIPIYIVVSINSLSGSSDIFVDSVHLSETDARNVQSTFLFQIQRVILHFDRRVIEHRRLKPRSKSGILSCL